MENRHAADLTLAVNQDLAIVLQFGLIQHQLRSLLTVARVGMPFVMTFMPKRDFTHLAICGMSFCGSTVLSLVLGTAAGVWNMGESHWLRDLAPQDPRGNCVFCGESCRFITRQFREEARTYGDWYPMLAERFAAKVLVSADKNPKLLRELDPQELFVRIVIYKHPLSAWRSHKRYLDRAGLSLSPADYALMWTELYREHLARARRDGLALVNFHAWSAQPATVSTHIFAATTGSERAINVAYWQADQHPVGGNFSVGSRLIIDPGALPIGSAPPLAEFDGLSDASDAIAPAMELYREMEGHPANIASAEAGFDRRRTLGFDA